MFFCPYIDKRGFLIWEGWFIIWTFWIMNLLNGSKRSSRRYYSCCGGWLVSCMRLINKGLAASLSGRWLSHLWPCFACLLRRIISRDSILIQFSTIRWNCHPKVVEWMPWGFPNFVLSSYRSSSRRNIRPTNLLQEHLKYEAQSSFDLFKNTNTQQFFESTLFVMDLSCFMENVTNPASFLLFVWIFFF